MTAETDTYLRGFLDGAQAGFNAAARSLGSPERLTAGSVRRSEPLAAPSEGERTQRYPSCPECGGCGFMAYGMNAGMPCLTCDQLPGVWQPHPGADA